MPEPASVNGPARARYTPGVANDELMRVLNRAVADGVTAAAVLDRAGKPLAVAGALAEDEARPLAGLVVNRADSHDLIGRMFGGEMIELSLEERDVSIGIAGRRVFVVVVLGAAREATREIATRLRNEVSQLLSWVQADLPGWTHGSGGSSSGPAELPVIELGVTVKRREPGKA